MAKNTEYLADFIREDAIFPYIQALPALYEEAYPRCWNRFPDYPLDIRVPQYCVSLCNEIHSTLYNIARDFEGIGRDLPKNKTKVYPYALISSENFKLTSSRVGTTMAPRHSEFRSELVYSGLDSIFDEPTLEFDEPAYLQILHGWYERKKYSLKPDFLKLKYVSPSLGKALYLDVYKLGGINPETLQVTVPPEPIVPIDNFQFKEIKITGKAENE